MTPFRGLRRYFRFARAHVGRHLYSMWGLGLVAAAVEGFGILLFIPILTRLVSEGSAAAPGRLAAAVSDWAAGFSIEGLLALLVALFAVKGALLFAIGVYRTRVVSGAREHLRVDLFGALGQVHIREAAGQRLGGLGNLIVHEIDNAAHATDRFCAALGSATAAFALFAIAVVLNPALSAVLVLSGDATLALVRQIARARMRISRAATERSASLASIAVETMRGFKYLRATGRFPGLQGAFGRAAREARAVDDRAAVVDHLRWAIREPLLVAWIGAVFYLFVVVLRQSLGVITDGILFFYRVSIELSFLQDYWQDFAARVGSIDAYERLRVELRAAEVDEDAGAPVRFEREIALDKVGFSYGGVAVLRDVDLVVAKRQMVALVGASGSGKSTAIDLVAACLDPTTGAVRVDGVDLRCLSQREYRSRLGYVTQEPVVFSGSVARNITMEWNGPVGPEAKRRARDAAALANCLTFIEALDHGWDTELDERGARLSGGELQRIAIARELYREPELLILDEATSALDSVSERAVQQSLEGLHGQLTLLVVAHRLSTIRDADLIYVLDAGRVVERGTFDTLVSDPQGRFRELCAVQGLV